MVISWRPGASVVGRPDGSAIRLDLHDGAGEINRVQVYGVSGHVKPEDLQVRQIAILHGNIGLGYFPCVLLPQHTGVCPCLIYGSLPVCFVNIPTT